MTVANAIQELHDRCAIYTSSSAAERLLDLADWNSESDLSDQVLLEPCVGEGAILIEGVRRLLTSVLSRGGKLTRNKLLARIKGFELHPGAASAARRNVHRVLTDHGVMWDLADTLAHAWVAERDFLLERPGDATHIVANPPYVRWSKLPTELATVYREALPAVATRGDLAVAFLYRMQDWSKFSGSITALVSDRWMFAQYGATFLAASTSRGWHLEVVDERPKEPFVRQVGAYSAIVRFTRTAQRSLQQIVSSRAAASRHHAALLERYGSLSDAGCKVRVGPALGAGQTFLLEEHQVTNVEKDLIRPFVEKVDLRGEMVEKIRRRVIIPYDRDGRLIDVAAWPNFEAWARDHERSLRKRSQFRGALHYWRTIDTVPSIWSVTPKLLMPELSTRPRVVFDPTDSIPAHSVYAIWPGQWPITTLQRVLNGGLLDLTAESEAPRLQHGWFRFYKRFIVRTPLPSWNSLTDAEREDLSGTGEAFNRRFLDLFGFPVGRPFNS